jgi:DNA polymerase sigma
MLIQLNKAHIINLYEENEAFRNNMKNSLITGNPMTGETAFNTAVAMSGKDIKAKANDADNKLKDNAIGGVDREQEKREELSRKAKGL